MVDILERPGSAMVTGASSGIGAEFATRLAMLGWDLVLVARRAQRLVDLATRLRAEHGVAAVELVADLSSPADLDLVAERAAASEVRLLVNNAGINGYGPFADGDLALLAKVIAVNVTAPTVLTRVVLPGMLARGGGAVVNVASLLAFSGGVPPVPPMPRRVVYGGAKAYLLTFSRILAAELDGAPVQVQVLCPGLTATEFHLTTGEVPVPGRTPRVHPDGGMPAADVVTASLAALRSGETVCVPGLAEPDALHHLATAEAALRSVALSPLASRYTVTGDR